MARSLAALSFVALSLAAPVAYAGNGDGVLLGNDAAMSAGAVATMVADGNATWYNPAWLFLNGFHRVFLRISQGASRLQEVLADRWSAFTYGAKAFEDGLTHVIRRSVLFNAHVQATMNEVINAKLPLANLYAFQPAAAAVSTNDIEGEIREALSREPSPYDSHPSPVDRFRWVRAIGGTVAVEEGEDVWSLFRDREDVERRLTIQVRANVAAHHGIHIPGKRRRRDRTGGRMRLRKEPPCPSSRLSRSSFP
jgi:hypothetical protein